MPPSWACGAMPTVAVTSLLGFAGASGPGGQQSLSVPVLSLPSQVQFMAPMQVPAPLQPTLLQQLPAKGGGTQNFAMPTQDRQKKDHVQRQKPIEPQGGQRPQVFQAEQHQGSAMPQAPRQLQLAQQLQGGPHQHLQSKRQPQQLRTQPQQLQSQWKGKGQPPVAGDFPNRQVGQKGKGQTAHGTTRIPDAKPTNKEKKDLQLHQPFAVGLVAKDLLPPELKTDSAHQAEEGAHGSAGGSHGAPAHWVVKNTFLDFEEDDAGKSRGCPRASTWADGLHLLAQDAEESPFGSNAKAMNGRLPAASPGLLSIPEQERGFGRQSSENSTTSTATPTSEKPSAASAGLVLQSSGQPGSHKSSRCDLSTLNEEGEEDGVSPKVPSATGLMVKNTFIDMCDPESSSPVLRAVRTAEGRLDALA